MRVSGGDMVRAVACLLVVVPVAAAQNQTQPPVFRSTVEVTSVDVSVVDRGGQPIDDLTPDEFSVEIDGDPRPVVSAEWVALEADDTTPLPPPLPEGYSTNEGGTSGRLIVLVVDQPNIRFGGGRALMLAAGRFLDSLQPSDRVAVVGFGLGAPSTAFLSDRTRLKDAIALMHGQMESLTMGRITGTRMALSEALAIDRGDAMVQQAVTDRECSQEPPEFRDICAAQVVADSRAIVIEAGTEGDRTVRGLRELLKALAGIEAPKTLVLMTEGFVMLDRDESPLVELGNLAAAARTSIYVMKLEDNYFDITEPGMPLARGEDQRQRTEGVMALAAASRGTVFNVVGTGDILFERIAAEISGYYLLGVESAAGDRDGKAHPVRVRVSRRGATVRARRTLLDRSALERAAPRTMREQVVRTLTSPLLSSALPLRVVTFSLRDQDPTKVQLLIHADVGSEYTGERQVGAAYSITDLDGNEVQSFGSVTRVGPVMNGVPSPLLFTAGASLLPGDYRLKLAVVEGDRVGSVEHRFHAELGGNASVEVSDLMVGGPADLRPRQQPLVTPVASFGALQGYLEAYGKQSSTLHVRYEVATDDDGPAILTSEPRAAAAGETRTIFSSVMPVRQLPPGAYRLRAIVTSGDEPVAALSRAFEIEPPRVLLSSATGVGAGSVPDDVDLFLPVEESDFAKAFEAGEALAGPTLDRFRAFVDASVQKDFDAGVSQLKSGDYPKAEESFKRAIRPDVDSMPGLVYLAATFAAAGQDVQAAGAWQTALIDGDDNPEIYRWLAEALLRSHDLGEARSILDEAAGKWPSDPRFTRPLAMLYATFGRGREAVRTIERYLEQRPDDVEALQRAVEWIYNLRLSGAAANGPDEDRELAREYANAYAQADGPEIELVRQWVAFLEDPREP